MRKLIQAGCVIALIVWPSVVDAAAACPPLRKLLEMDMVRNPANMPAVPVTLANKRTLLIVDTGAFWSFVFPGIVRELNLNPVQVPVRAYGVNGRYADRAVRLPFMLGPVNAGERQFMVRPGDATRVIGENEPGGLLGAEILSNFDVDFDFPAGKFRLFHSDHCEGQVVHWQASAVAVVPFLRRDGRLDSDIEFPVLVNGRRVTALLDTGASHTVMSIPAARRAFDFAPDAAGVEQIGEMQGVRPVPIYRTRIDKIEFEGVSVNNPVIHVMPDVVSRETDSIPIGSLIPVSRVQLPDVLLGMTVLSKLHVYIAYKERKVYLSAPPAAETAPAAQ